MSIRTNTTALLLLSNALASVGTGVAMIVIPWLIVTDYSNSLLLGTLATVVNFVLFLLTPFIGPVIDFSSRRYLMIALRLVFIVGLSLVAGLTIIDSDGGSKMALVIYYILGSTFYAFNVPLRSAYTQELYSRDQLIKVNSILEIENQVAAVLTGVLGIYLVERVGLMPLIFLNMVCLAIAIMCIKAIGKNLTPAGPAMDTGVLGSMKEGFAIAYRKPTIFAILMMSSIPYVVVILYTVIHPTVLATFPQATVTSYAIVETLFAIGAISGGVLINRFGYGISKLEKSIAISVSAFALIAVVQALMPTYWSYLCIATCFGAFNATTRALRQTLLMSEYSERQLGRLSALLQSYIMLCRAALLFVLSRVVFDSDRISGSAFAAFVSCFAAGAILVILFRRASGSEESILVEKP